MLLFIKTCMTVNSIKLLSDMNYISMILLMINVFQCYEKMLFKIKCLQGGSMSRTHLHSLWPPLALRQNNPCCTEVGKTTSSVA